jgi:hypothetical protein
VGKLNAREKKLQAETRRKAGLKAAKTRASKPKTPSLKQLLCPLTPTQKDGIREVLPTRQAKQFLRDWERISAVGYHYALFQHAFATSKSDTPKQRDKQEEAVKAAVTALKDAATQLDTYAEHWGPIRKSWFPFETQTPEAFTHGVKALIGEQRDRLAIFLQKDRERPMFPPQSGRPKSPTRYFLEVVLAYFRDRQWDDTVPRTDLSNDSVCDAEESPFVEVAFVLLGHTSMRPPTRRALAASSLNYAALEDTAPVLTREQRKCGRT